MPHDTADAWAAGFAEALRLLMTSSTVDQADLLDWGHELFAGLHAREAREVALDIWKCVGDPQTGNPH